ncbi:Anhydro-N-acetylmuramic acid kinase [Candidatus Magnetaquicoccaceae bacterium FCR-1]|uniref:Anhydro-N-acetylmuramic acid kinase n=1 Tax=Candidatus Magnetaquiglobus chichijimensis TaxID=3141448 RepID=A0ABQ0CBZ4_9PROT
MDEARIAIGLMSGTSADGIDAVLVRTDGVRAPRVLADLHLPYPEDLHRRILALYQPGENEIDRLGVLHRELGGRFAEAALRVCQRGGLSIERVAVIGSHGQTVRHRPPDFTLQIADPFVIAARTGVVTVADFRPADLARGGEGAPLVPLFHQVLFARPGQRVAVVNLGGIANVTALAGDDRAPLIAGDTGPANTLLDLLATRLNGGARAVDRNGDAARRGRVDDEALAWLMAHPYLARPFPKSTGREAFGSELLERFLTIFPHLAGDDGFATLTRFTVESVVEAACRLLPPYPERMILCGGGARNPALVAGMAHRLPLARIADAEDLGVDVSTLEAQAFAWFAVRTLRGLTSSVTGATGAEMPAVLGAIHPVTVGQV